jgi:hypothetical protein
MSFSWNGVGASDAQAYWLNRGMVGLAITSQAIQGLLRRRDSSNDNRFETP